MSELLEKYNKLRQSRGGLYGFDQLKAEIDKIPRIDNDAVSQSIASGMMRFFTDDYKQSQERKEEIINQLGQVILNAAKVNKQNITDAVNELVKSVNKTEKAINNAIGSIPETDISGLEKNISKVNQAINGIKPVDLTGLQNDIRKLTQAVYALNEEADEEEINLDGVIEALNKPVNVRFDIEYDEWDFPVTINATEVK